MSVFLGRRCVGCVCERCHLLKSCVKPSRMKKLKIIGYNMK